MGLPSLLKRINYTGLCLHRIFNSSKPNVEDGEWEKGVPDEVMDALTDLAATFPLYYEDAYLREFEATVLRAVEFKDRLYIVLNQTCFFPEGGGQPKQPVISLLANIIIPGITK